MLGKGHAVSGAALWLTGWSWASVAGLAHPHLDVLTIGTLVTAGAALVPDLDHPKARLAQTGGPVTEWVARKVGRAGSLIHGATKRPADRPDLDGHRTITHTLVFAVLAGAATAALAGLADDLGRLIAALTGVPALHVFGRLLPAGIVFTLVKLGFTAARANFGGRQRRVRLLGRRRRWRKPTVVAGLAALATYVMVPAGVWWLGVAVTAGCVAHLLGDIITASGCPVLWPLPIPSTVQRYNRKLRRRESVRVWRTWYLVGTPRWMRFSVGGPAERIVTRWIISLGVLAVAGLVYAYGWMPAAG
jgi:membrane-bound metal-dependent hydrolase YbcI (DUF457 family)